MDDSLGGKAPPALDAESKLTAIMKIIQSFLIALILISSTTAQNKISDDYLILNAGASDPLFTTYAAAMNRSRFFADKAYFMNYFTPDQPITYSSQFAGDWAVIWKINNVVVNSVRDFINPPLVVVSFPDMAILEYEPFQGLKVQETFFVYSSGAAIIDMQVRNSGDIKYNFSLYPVLFTGTDSFSIERYDAENRGYVFTHQEPLERLHSNLYKDRDYPTDFRNFLTMNLIPDSYGGYNDCHIQDFYFAIKRRSKVHDYVTKLNESPNGKVKLLSLQKNFALKPGETVAVRFVRGVQDARKPQEEMLVDIKAALTANLQSFVDTNATLFKSVPRITFKDPKEKMVYIGAFNLVRQCMLPSRAHTSFNYYVFSRNPIWGWGHGHQVMHESLSMLAYVYLDAKSAQESQRVYMEQQLEDGLIAYRHGPRGPQDYPHEGKPTTSAPFFSWTNWEIYRVSKDRVFLQDAYQAGTKYIHYLEKERDKDRDGMYEWGPYGIIENVRDGWNVVFQLFSEGKDEGRDISDELDALDLTAQVANEMYYLKLMAKELGDSGGVKEWSEKYEKTASLINQYMWDPQDRFYYHVSMYDNSMTFEGRSLKRKEIIGFLPMWAQTASKEQASALIEHLTNENSFWRTFGVPTLAADDPLYYPFVDGCCRWNGPVWLLWNYMVFDGLKKYGYHDLAKQLADKMMLAVTYQLEKNHCFWESYSPDFPVLECPSNYIWDAIMAKVLIDVYR